MNKLTFNLQNGFENLLLVLSKIDDKFFYLPNMFKQNDKLRSHIRVSIQKLTDSMNESILSELGIDS